MRTSYNDTWIVRAAAILTNAFVIGKLIESVYGDNQLVLYLDFTIGSLDDAQIKIEYSKDRTDWYQESTETISGGVKTVTPIVHKLTATGKPRLGLVGKDKYIRISAIGTGTVTGSSLKILGITGNT